MKLSKKANPVDIESGLERTLASPRLSDRRPMEGSHDDANRARSRGHQPSRVDPPKTTKARKDPSLAEDEVLLELHREVAREFLRKVKSGEARASDMAAAVKFLACNGVYVVKAVGQEIDKNERMDAFRQRFEGRLPVFDDSDKSPTKPLTDEAYVEGREEDDQRS